MSNLSHESFSTLKESDAEILRRIDGDQTLLMEYKKLKETSLGQFLIKNRGLNGLWTDRVVNYNLISKHERNKYSNYDKYLLGLMPCFIATQERFGFFKRELERLATKYKLKALSAPSGLLPEFYNIESSRIITLDALDIDEINHEYISDKYKSNPLLNKINFINSNIFSFNRENYYDVIVSNGLNIYIEDVFIIEKMYKIFYSSLNVGGTLITSFLTPPPSLTSEGEVWEMSKINQDNLNKQKLIFGDILNISWFNYRSENEFLDILKNIGFINIRVIWDQQKMFPTVIAIK